MTKPRLMALLAVVFLGGVAGLVLGLLFLHQPGQGTLQVSSEPSGASVFLDHKFAGTTPLDLFLLAMGEHQLRLAHRGFHDKTMAVVVQDAHSAVRVTLDPLPPSGTVLVHSEPAGALVWIDGEGGLTTPALLEEIPAGTHELRVELPGWLPYQEAIEVMGNKQTTLSVRLNSRKLAYYEGAIQKEPHKLSNYTELGRIYFLEGEVDKVFEMLGKAFEVLVRSGRPSDKGFRELLRLACNAEPDPRSARWKLLTEELLVRFRESSSYGPGFALFHSVLARAGQWKEIADLCTHVLSQDNNARQFYIWRIQALSHLGDSQRVIEDLEALDRLGISTSQPVVVPMPHGGQGLELGWVTAMWVVALAKIELNDLKGAAALTRHYETQPKLHYWAESIRGELWLRNRQGDPPKPWLEAAPCPEEAPVIDGLLDDTPWKSARRFSKFYHWQGDNVSALNSVVQGLYDNTCLYLAMDFEEKDPAKRKAASRPAGMEVFLTDAHIELFVDPDRDYQTYKQIMLNALGTQVNIDCIKPQRFDPLFEGNQAWNPLYQSAVSVDERGWRVELALPFAIFDAAAPKSGDAWTFNVVRCQGGGGQDHASFVPVYGSYHQPERFALLLFR